MLQPRIERFDTVVSTNELIKRALEANEEEGLVCRAAEQTGGYGRQGRSWSSPRGGLYQSLLLRPEVPATQLATLNLIAALCARRALLSAGALPSAEVQVKWPNDVVCDQGKLAGISLESHAGGVCLGIGVNVWPPALAQKQSLAGKYAPAYLSEMARNGMRDEPERRAIVDFVGDEVLNAFWGRYLQWRREGFAAFADEFNACSSLTGKQVEIADRNGKVVQAGCVVGVNADGCLLVGETAVSSGEAHIL